VHAALLCKAPQLLISKRLSQDTGAGIHSFSTVFVEKQKGATGARCEGLVVSDARFSLDLSAEKRT